MSSNDYTPVTSGALKLKGLPSKLSKKKRPKPALPSSGTAEEEVEDRDKVVSEEHKDTKEEDQVGSDKDTNNEEQQSSIPKVRKTEAEIRHEQRRRRKLNERLKREGIKTHKERVEELNRYLSNLSEHHDMPRIGPG